MLKLIKKSVIGNETGEKRSNFGRWVDKQKDLNELELERASNISRGTISKLCSDPNYRPKISTVIKINQGLKKLDKNMDLNDFFTEVILKMI
ncbi:transcriptional regulator [[Brevibacterium] frigoritolerans]|uniref:Transcriptional regulator n=1 Tax=Peribacillus frigoritolerans TaxID=450367 RepID=A0A941FPT8_9BACI|nr:transcriptional regulator [Peribacillus frigoritolerans]